MVETVIGGGGGLKNVRAAEVFLTFTTFLLFDFLPLSSVQAKSMFDFFKTKLGKVFS